MSDVLRSAFTRTFRRENRRAGVRRGTLEKIAGFESSIFGNQRDLTIYLPPGYAEHAERRYPVLYFQDGQNLFEPDRAYVRGQHWRLGEAADAAINRRTARPMIIVGVDHAGDRRIDEYTPTRDAKRKAGGRADDYARMLLEEVRPLIESRYRTSQDEIAAGGSSLGGLLSLCLILRHPETFGGAIVMSPSVWWGGRAILDEIDRFKGDTRPRLWLDVGSREGKEAVSDVRLLHDRMLASGWNSSNFRYHEDRRGDHSERAWAARVQMALEFLFPPE